MPCVLVPLDETPFAETILPNAEELAGPGGRIALVYVAARAKEADDLERYFSNEAQLLQSRGFKVSTKVLVGGNIPRAIDEGVTEFGAEIVAVATHGAEHHGRLSRSSSAWKALAHSPVPILYRHAREGQIRDLAEPMPQPIKIMVPLDGSERAEQALPLAASLATQWKGSIVLVQASSNQSESEAYLDRALHTLSVPAERKWVQGQPADALARLASESGITHVVMTSHGRTGLSRMLAGDVAAQLIDRLSLPIIVVPVLTEQANEQPRDSAQKAPASAVSK